MRSICGACRYHTLGYRSLGPTRARVYGGADYAERANDTIIALAMIETQKGYDNRDEIMSVEGLDGVFIGIGDLRLTMTGRAGLDASDAIVDAALDELSSGGATTRGGRRPVCRGSGTRCRNDPAWLPDCQRGD